jgi:hypothetical protein
MRFADQQVILLELGTGGAKIEHQRSLAIGARHLLPLRDAALPSVVRYCTLAPSETGIVYHTGVAFGDLTREQTESIYEILLDEARQQVAEWEANAKGDRWERPEFGPRSAVALRYVWLRLASGRWSRTVTTDPNQPIDGVAVPGDTPEDDIALLCATYERGDDALRDYLRGCAMVAILERLRSGN